MFDIIEQLGFVCSKVHFCFNLLGGKFGGGRISSVWKQGWFVEIGQTESAHQPSFGG